MGVEGVHPRGCTPATGSFADRAVINSITARSALLIRPLLAPRFAGLGGCERGVARNFGFVSCGEHRTCGNVHGGGPDHVASWSSSNAAASRNAGDTSTLSSSWPRRTSWMKACPWMTTLAVRFVFEPCIGSSLALGRPWLASRRSLSHCPVHGALDPDDRRGRLVASPSAPDREPSTRQCHIERLASRFPRDQQGPLGDPRASPGGSDSSHTRPRQDRQSVLRHAGNRRR